MTATLGILVALGAILHTAGAGLRLRSTSPMGRWLALIGALVVAGSGVGVLAVAAAQVDTRIATAWALGGAVVMVAGHGLGSARHTRWPALVTSLAGLGAALTASWLLQLAPRAAIDTAPLVATAWTTAHSTCLAGGLAFLLLGLLVASDDARLRHVSWPAVGLVVGAIGLSLVIGTGGSVTGAPALALSDAQGVAVEIRASIVTTTSASAPIGVPAVHTLPALTPLLLGTTGLAVVGGALAMRNLRGARAFFVAGALGSILAMALVLAAIGAQPLPSDGAVLEQLAAAGVATELLADAPGLSAPQVWVHPASALPVVVVCWLMAAICAVRALTPPVEVDDPTVRGHRHFAPGALLSTSRDAVMLAALLLWLAVALAMFANLTTVERFVADHRVTAHVACAVLAVTSVMGWHAALGRASRTGFVLWLVVLLVTIAIAAVVLISGAMTATPLKFLAIGA